MVYLVGVGGSHWAWEAESRELEDLVWKGSLQVLNEVLEQNAEGVREHSC